MWEKEAVSKGTMFREILAFKQERKLKGYSIMEVVVIFCEELDKDIDEVGALLKKDKIFTETLKQDLKFNFEATFDDDAKQNKMSEWL